MSVKQEHRPHSRVRGRWGNWRFKGDTFVLTATVQSGMYEFDFDKCRNSAGILDQIVQLYTIGWFTDKDIRDLLKGIDAVLKPQANYCSAGRSKAAKPREVARRGMSRPLLKFSGDSVDDYATFSASFTTSPSC